MPSVTGVRFRHVGPVYYFDPTDIDVCVNDWVVVDTSRGLSLGQVTTAVKEVDDSDIQEPLKAVLRKADPEDIAHAQELRSKESDTLKKCGEMVAKYKLPMKLIAAEYNLDGSYLTIFFSAENKVDFRSLLRELGSTFKARVELRQIGARDEAKLIGGFGKCGRCLCCTTHLCRFEPITVRMARDQDLPLNPTKISGACGKLLCCLKYERDQYVEMKKQLPKLGQIAITPSGSGKVIHVNALRELITVRIDGEVTVHHSLSDIKVEEKG